MLIYQSWVCGAFKCASTSNGSCPVLMSSLTAITKFAPYPIYVRKKCCLLFLNNSFCSRVLLPWQRNGFQISPIVKAFLVIFGISFCYLPTIWCLISIMRLSIQICQVKFMALFNVFPAENHKNFENRFEGTDHTFKYPRLVVMSLNKVKFYSASVHHIYFPRPQR